MTLLLTYRIQTLSVYLGFKGFHQSTGGRERERGGGGGESEEGGERGRGRERRERIEREKGERG